MSNTLIDKSNVSELDGYDNEAKYFRFCTLKMQKKDIFLSAPAKIQKGLDADCLFTCN